MIMNNMFRIFRKMSILYLEKFWSVYNKFLFQSYVTEHGKISIIGRFHIYVARTAQMKVGENFKLVSSHLINPLCVHPSTISVGDGAIVSIGNNVGMSSPNIWIRKGLTIGSNVNIGGELLF